MKTLALICSLLIAGCTITVKPSDDVVAVVNNQGKEIQKQAELINQLAQVLKVHEDRMEDKGWVKK